MKVHIIGIAGKATSALAHMLIKKGWQVSGSDANVYPPASTFLESIGVAIKTPYGADNLTVDTDLVVVGGNALLVDPHNVEYEKAILLGKRVVNYPEVLSDYVVKKNSIVVAGNFGKGTVSGALTFVFSKLGLNPSFMVGGQMVDLPESLVSADGDWSIIEGDEYPVPPMGDQVPTSKFFYYKPRYVILTSAEWDHYDQFPTEDMYVKNYIEFIKLLPKDGLLVVNRDGKNIDKIIPFAPCRVVTYSRAGETDYRTKKLSWNGNVIGSFNNDNLTAAYALCAEFGFDHVKVRQALDAYRGLKQRMEIVYEHHKTIVVRDLAHSPVKAQAAISAVLETWPDRNILVVFDMFSSSLKNSSVLAEFDHRFDGASTVYVPKVSITKTDETRITGKDIVTAISRTFHNVLYAPKQELLLDDLVSRCDSCVYLLLSSGGMNGLSEKLIQRLIIDRAEQKMLHVLTEYTNFLVGEKRIKIPYVINRKRFNLMRTAGKGTPQMIRTELNRIAKTYQFDLDSHSESEIFAFMNENEIGVECSGFAYHLLHAYVVEILNKPLSSILAKPKGIINALVWVLFKQGIVRHVNADMLTSEKNTIKVAHLSDVRVGDLIRLSVKTPGDHVLLVVDVTKKLGVIESITYAHSSYQRTVSQGPHTAHIRVIDSAKGLHDQDWQEKTPAGVSYSIHFHPERGDGIRRLRALTIEN